MWSLLYFYIQSNQHKVVGSGAVNIYTNTKNTNTAARTSVARRGECVSGFREQREYARAIRPKQPWQWLYMSAALWLWIIIVCAARRCDERAPHQASRMCDWEVRTSAHSHIHGNTKQYLIYGHFLQRVLSFVYIGAYSISRELTQYAISRGKGIGDNCIYIYMRGVC